MAYYIPVIDNRVRTGMVMHSYGSRFLNEACNRTVKCYNYQKGLNISSVNVKWCCGGGWTLNKFKNKAWDELLSFHPQVVYIELGFNELDNTDSIIPLALKYNDLMNELLNEGVRVVVMAEVLYHEGIPRYITREQFNTKVDRFNNFMSGALEWDYYGHGDLNRFVNPRKWWWRHPDMFRQTEQPMRLPDGVHLTPTFGMKRWYQEVRRAVMLAADYVPYTY